MGRLPLIVAVIAAIALCGCAEQPHGRALPERSVLQAPVPWPTPQSVRGGPPHLQALWMNETTIPVGSDWIGRAVTSTNVASLEIRTESFTFVAERTNFGQFQFKQHMLDIVPEYKRGYTLQVIARNAAGDKDVVLVPISFR